MSTKTTAFTHWLVMVVGIARPAVADDAQTDYARDIKPILKARCYACHGALKQESGLRLDTAAAMLKGGSSGPVVVAGKADASELISRVASNDAMTHMPPEGAPLTAEQIERMRQWIQQGASGIPNEVPEQDPRDHWAFRKPERPPLPKRKADAEANDGSRRGTPARPVVDATGQSADSTESNPIDAFILARLEAEGIAPRPRADKATWLRRVTLDLIGLPSTREELQAFAADESAAAHDAVVDRLLNDPRYAERWARHWMDVWRYADWHGRRHVPDVWNSAPQIWRWRDWIVRSLNNDHGYDRMVREMLAADEICPEDDAAAVATGYLIRNWYALNPNDWMRANVEHVGKAFLGLTFNCAHCHDHKYDPITQDDYFRLRAFFEPIGIRQDRVPGEADPGPYQEYNYSVLRKIQRLGAVRVFDKTPAAPTWFYMGGDERNRVASRGTMTPSVPAFLASSAAAIEPISLPARSWYPGLRPAIQDTILTDQRAANATTESAIATIRTETEKALPPLREQVLAAEAEFAAAKHAAQQKGSDGVLSGKQSLLLDAVTGRRVVQNGLTQLKSLDDGTTISFQLRILQDAHVNFQLAQDVVQGLTAGFVAFEKGRILSYQPGSFTEIQAGQYDVAAGQIRFEISLILETKADRCLLSVRSLDDSTFLVDKLSVALNGWNPFADPKKGILFDARTGSVAAVDEVLVTGPSTAAGGPVRLVHFGFEPPVYPENTDAVGIEGWQASSFGATPATSLVTSAIGESATIAASQKLRAAQRAAAVHELMLPAAQAKHAAGLAVLASLEARIAADRAKHGETPNANIEELARKASRLQRAAALSTAEADVIAADQALAATESKPPSDAKRAPEIETAAKQLAAARSAVEKARAALDDPQPVLEYPTFGAVYPQNSTGRRRALAQWITHRDNPLTARVAVNHVWMRHFHAPLVSSVFDFGRNGARPTHPELLDWLAVEFMESGWSSKHLHRLIVTSEAYRRVSSVGDAARFASDPENRLLWRMNTGRMEAEVVRDSLLFVAGRLDLTMGGQELENDRALTTNRRTLYYSCQPETDGKSQFGALFDAPEPSDCYRRTRSVIPQQALALTNSELIHELSGQLATAIWQQVSLEQQPQSLVTVAFESILGRPPSDAERAACMQFLQPANEQPDAARVRESFVRALLNHNDFIAIR